MADSDSRAGDRYAPPAILDWCVGVHAAHDDALARAFATPAGVPAIMVGPSEGQLVALLCRLAGVRRAVEVGTLIGYSALHLARALPADGHLWTIEFERAHADLARANLAGHGALTFASGAPVELVVADVSHGLFAPLAPITAAHGPIDRIVHLAAQVSVVHSLANPLVDVAVNYVGTVQVLEYARAAGVRKVVFASSAAVYGDTAHVPVPEDVPCRPLSPYGVDKLASELMLRAYASTHGLASTPRSWRPRSTCRSRYHQRCRS